MALNLKASIFDTDPDAAPREPRQYEGPEFSVLVYDYDGNSPVKLDGFMFKVAHPENADAIKELYGGRTADLDHKRYTTSVETERQSLDVIITDVESDMKLWNGSTLVHHCTGTTFLSDPPGRSGMVGQPCGCPETLRERKDAAKGKYGPKPDIRIKFRLSDDQELGAGEVRTGSWDLSGELESYIARHLAEAESADPSGEIASELAIRQVEFTINKGKNKGTVVSYQYPTLRNIRPLNEAISE